jgi:hypothetical protein
MVRPLGATQVPMMANEHRRRYRVCYGITVEFVLRLVECRKDEVRMTALVCECDPARSKFLRRSCLAATC